MRYCLIFNENKIASKEIAGLMSCILHTVVGSKNDEINGWELNQSEVASLVLNALSLKQPNQLRLFQARFQEHYWSKAMISNPAFFEKVVDYICDVFSDTLAKMIISDTYVVLAYWDE